MDQEEKELLEKYRGLLPENKISALSILRVTLAAQENTRRAMEREAAREPAGVPA